MFLHVLISVTLFSTIALCYAATINQRQTGETNIHVNVKDFKIVALLKNTKEEYMDYDYAYDYSEMTIKPQPNGNTTTSSTIKPTENSTETSTQLITESNALDATSNDPISNDTNLPITDAPLSTTLAALSSSTILNLEGSSSTTRSANATVCKKGFTVNTKGECELKLQNSSTNALLKLVKLSQKLKLRREN